MKLFRTPVEIAPSNTKITYRKKLFFVGSCFAENIGHKLIDAKFGVDMNPFGIVYNPLSVGAGLHRLLQAKLYEKEELFYHGQLWGSFDHHSRFSHPDAEACLENINDRIKISSVSLRQADFIFITFGTSYVYHLKEGNRLVSNCHKFPASDFTRERISVDTIVVACHRFLDDLFKVNPGVTVVFTVSPIRHWKDGPHDNQLSKSGLLLAIDEICRSRGNTQYFPSYEIMMDELRDYRFYAGDMLHPDEVATDYIWERFTECYMDSKTVNEMMEVGKIIQAANHKPFNPDLPLYRDFVMKTLEKIEMLKAKSGIDFLKEETFFRQFLNTK